MPYLRAVGFVLVMAASFVFLVPVQAVARQRGWAAQHKIQMYFCRAMCAAIGIEIAPTGMLPDAAPRVLVANHISWTDILALASQYPLTFLAKREVASWPLLGFLARLQGTIFVERESRKDVGRVNEAIGAALQSGSDVVIFAEGTSSDGKGILPFRPAHFAPLVALDPAPALAPVAISYMDRAGAYVDVGWYGEMTFLPHLWSLMNRNGDLVCRIAFGAPVLTAGKDRKALATETQLRVDALLNSTRQ